ncbi:hypothetical protein BSKO_01470 [Bryopsis sp. KO-2023]|nr:hypothetical protein BSKO_01470 [Bryopsis sp. KO-2023]
MAELDEDVLAAALMDRPGEQQQPETSRKRAKRAPTVPAPRCSKCNKKPQRRCEHQLCAKCCVAAGNQCSIHIRKGDVKRTSTALQPRVTTTRDLSQAHATYQQEAEESRLWYHWVFERIQESASGRLDEAMDRYSKNASWLAEVMDGGCTVENHKEANCTLEKLDAEYETFLREHQSGSDMEGEDMRAVGQDDKVEMEVDSLDSQEVPIKKAFVPVEIQDAERKLLIEFTNRAPAIQL